MKPTQKQFNTALNRLSREGLSDADKQAMLAHITGASHAAVASPYTSWSRLGRKVAAGVSVASLGFGSLAFASTASLPDELLYPVKTDIVEPLVELTKLSAESRQAYQIDLAHERLEELIELEENGELDAELRLEVESDFIAHLAEADSYPESETAQDALELAARAFIAVASDQSDEVAEAYIDEADNTLELDMPIDLDAVIGEQAGDVLDSVGDTLSEEVLNRVDVSIDKTPTAPDEPKQREDVDTQTDVQLDTTLREVVPRPTLPAKLPGVGL